MSWAWTISGKTVATFRATIIVTRARAHTRTHCVSACVKRKHPDITTTASFLTCVSRGDPRAFPTGDTLLSSAALF